MKKYLLLIIILFALIGCDKKDDGSIDTDISKQNTKLEIPAWIVGKWESASATKMSEAKTIENIEDVFKKPIPEYGSYIELKADGTFIDKIEPDTSRMGTYEMAENRYIIGDYYALLHYSDGSEGALRKEVYDNAVIYLVYDKLINGYKINLEKQ